MFRAGALFMLLMTLVLGGHEVLSEGLPYGAHEIAEFMMLSVSR